MKTNLTLGLMLVGMLAIAGPHDARAHCGACGTDVHKTEAQTMGKETTGMGTIVETAMKAGDFETLVTAVKAAGLVETLSGEGPFTVFAPTDDAFAAIPEEVLTELLQDKEALTSVLTYHVVPGKMDAAAVSKRSVIKTVNGAEVTVAVDGRQVSIDGAKVTMTDLVCSNGIIHVIDAVIMPSEKDIIETAQAAGSFEKLLTALEAAGLTEALQGRGPFTVFAPSDAAFAKLPDGTLESLLANKQSLSKLLTYHVVPGRIAARDITAMDEALTLSGSAVGIDATNGVRVGGATVVQPDIYASNGVIHIIDEVLLPN